MINFTNIDPILPLTPHIVNYNLQSLATCLTFNTVWPPSYTKSTIQGHVLRRQLTLIELFPYLCLQSCDLCREFFALLSEAQLGCLFAVKDLKKVEVLLLYLLLLEQQGFKTVERERKWEEWKEKGWINDTLEVTDVM